MAVNGSPRKGGNTETLIDHALAPLQAAGWETERLKVGARKIRGGIAWLGKVMKPRLDSFPDNKATFE